MYVMPCSRCMDACCRIWRNFTIGRTRKHQGNQQQPEQRNARAETLACSRSRHSMSSMWLSSLHFTASLFCGLAFSLPATSAGVASLGVADVGSSCRGLTICKAASFTFLEAEAVPMRSGTTAAAATSLLWRFFGC